MCIQRDGGSREFYAHFLGPRPGMAGLEHCESLFTHSKNKKVIVEKFAVRYLVAIQQALETQELGNVYWLPGLGNPAERIDGNPE